MYARSKVVETSLEHVEDAASTPHKVNFANGETTQLCMNYTNHRLDYGRDSDGYFFSSSDHSLDYVKDSVFYFGTV